jgi:integrase
MALANGDMPAYLLAVEVVALLHYIPDLYRQTLINTLWNTGARINEALALTWGNFMLAPPQPWVSLATLKQREEKAARGPGAPSKKQVTHRLVPLSDPHYVDQFQTMIATLKIPQERRNKTTGRMEPARVWTVTDRTVRTWINEAVALAAADGVMFSVPITPHTLLRHAYAVCRRAAQGIAGIDGARQPEIHRSLH